MAGHKRRYGVLLLTVFTILCVILAGTQLTDASTYYYFKTPAEGKVIKGGSTVNVSFYAGVVIKNTKFDAWGNPESTTYEEMPVTFKVFKGNKEIYSEGFTYKQGTTIETKYKPTETGTLKLRIYGRNMGLDQYEQVLQDTVTIKVKKPKASALKNLRPTITVDRAAKKKAVITCQGSFGYGMKVYRAPSKNGKYKLIKTTSKSKFTDTSIAGSKTYYYKVRLYAKSGKKTYTSKYSAKVKAEKYVASTDKTALKTVLTNTSKGVKVTWKKIDGAGYYLVWREGSNASENSDTWCLGENELEFIDTGAVKGKTYTYYVSAWHGNDEMPLVKGHAKITVK